MTGFLHELVTFSQQHCIRICVSLLGLMTIVSVMRLGLVIRQGSRLWINRCTGLIVLGTVLLVFHVISWWWSGVVMLPTYILPGVGGLYVGFCWGCNGWEKRQGREITDVTA